MSFVMINWKNVTGEGLWDCLFYLSNLHLHVETNTECALFGFRTGCFIFEWHVFLARLGWYQGESVWNIVSGTCHYIIEPEIKRYGGCTHTHTHTHTHSLKCYCLCKHININFVRLLASEIICNRDFFQSVSCNGKEMQGILYYYTFT